MANKYNSSPVFLGGQFAPFLGGQHSRFFHYIPFDVPYDNPIKYYNLGVKKLKQKKIYIAIKYFQHSINLGNMTKDTFYNFGVALHFNEEKDKACEAWRKALSLGDDEAESLIEKYCKNK